MFPELFSIGPLTFKTYGLMAGLGFIAAYSIFEKRLQSSGVEARHFSAILWLALIFGLLGARLLYAATNPFDWSEFFEVWKGGLSFLGGLILGTAAILAYLRRHRVPLFEVSDAAALALPAGHAIGRLGCFAAGCCWGAPTRYWIGVRFDDPRCLVPSQLRGLPLHPVQLYEAAGLGALAMALWAMRANARHQLLGWYLLFYGLLRFLLEFLRLDGLSEPGLGSLTFAQSLSLLLLIPAGLWWVLVFRRKQGLKI